MNNYAIQLGQSVWKILTTGLYPAQSGPQNPHVVSANWPAQEFDTPVVSIQNNSDGNFTNLEIALLAGGGTITLLCLCALLSIPIAYEIKNAKPNGAGDTVTDDALQYRAYQTTDNSQDEEQEELQKFIKDTVAGIAPNGKNRRQQSGIVEYGSIDQTVVQFPTTTTSTSNLISTPRNTEGSTSDDEFMNEPPVDEEVEINTTQINLVVKTENDQSVDNSERNNNNPNTEKNNNQFGTDTFDRLINSEGKIENNYV
jgi:hypothetical protein